MVDITTQAILDQTEMLRQMATQPVVALAAVMSFRASTATSTMLWNANSTRRGAILVNTDANDLYLRYGTTATTGSGGWTYKIPSGATWEMPLPIYGGRIDGIWTAAGAGVAQMTELV